MVNLSHYFIGKYGLHGVFHKELPHWTELTAESLNDSAASTDFELQHGLYAPNADDALELAAALQIGWQDGAEPYVPR